MTFQEILKKGATITLYLDGEPQDTTVIAPYIAQEDGKLAWFDLIELRAHLFRDVKLVQEHELAWWVNDSENKNLAYITLCSEEADPAYQTAFEEGWHLRSAAFLESLQESVDLMLEDEEEED